MQAERLKMREVQVRGKIQSPTEETPGDRRSAGEPDFRDYLAGPGRVAATV